jgi:hypothetical protein
MKKLAPALLALAVSLPAAAQLAPPDFRVSSPLIAFNGYVPAGSFYPAVTTTNSGDFLVVWSYLTTKNGHIFAAHAGRRFDAAASPLGAELAFGTSAQVPAPSHDVDAATLSTGDFVVAWTQYQPDTSSYVVGQRVSSSGGLLGSSFRVSTYTSGSTGLPRVSGGNSTRFVVTFLGSNEGSAGSGVFARRFQASGAPVGAEFLVATYSTAGVLSTPAVAANPNGDFVVVWDTYVGASHEIFAHRFDIFGNSLGGEFRVNGYTTGDQRAPAVAWDGSGGFVVVWTSPRDTDPLGGIFAQRYSADGAPVDAEFHVNSYTTGGQTFPAVSTDPGQGFIVAWTSPQDGALGGTVARRFTRSGTPITNEFRVNTYTTGTQLVPAIAGQSPGRFVTVWSSAGQYPQYVIYGQRLNTLRGDADTNGGRDLSDVFFIINALFAGGPPPLGPCGGDANGDGVVDVADVFYLINFFFAGGPPPPPC